MESSLRVQIIYLNGPSSSGKTTLAKALQNALNPPFLHIGIDKIIGMMPAKVNDWTGGKAELGYSWRSTVDENGHPLQELQMGPFAKQVSKAYKEIVVCLAKLGHQLIVDDVAFGETEMGRWRDLLKEFSVLYVGVKTPLDILESREKERGDRILGSARAQYYNVHTGNHYDLEMDTSGLSTSDCVSKILSRMDSAGRETT